MKARKLSGGEAKSVVPKGVNAGLVRESARGRAEPPADWSKELVTIEETRRVVENAMMAAFSVQVPKRLPDAGLRELRVDRSVGRTVANTYMNVWRALAQKREARPLPDWAALQELAAQNEAARRAGATVVWEDWLPDMIAEVEGRKTQISKFAADGGSWKWGAYRVRLIDFELAGLLRAKQKLKHKT